MSAQTPWWDAVALEAFLRQQTGAASVAVLEARRLSGGAIQENWWLRLQPAGAAAMDVVLRCDAASRVAESRSRAQEFALLRVAFEAGVTVPEPLWPGDGSLGRDFFIMRKADGIAAGHRVVKELALGGDRERLAERIGREMARLHRIRADVRLDFLPRPAVLPSADGLAQCRRFLSAHAQPHPALAWALRWLERHQPVAQDVVLTHRDLRTGNYMINADGLTAILDWEFAAWSDPMEDLGWFCARCWRFGHDGLEAGGIGSRAALYRGYEAESGHAVDDAAVRYWEVYAHLRWAVIALQQGARHVSGEERSLELALTAHIVPELELELLALTGAGGEAEDGPSTPVLALQPDSGDLLETAREVLLRELLPLLPASAGYTARMVANAMAIAGRGAAAGADAAEGEAIRRAWQALCDDVARGLLDGDDAYARAGRARLWHDALARVSLSAPRALPTRQAAQG